MFLRISQIKLSCNGSVINSLKILEAQYKKELNSKSVPGFIQFLSVTPLTISLWCEQDVHLYHEMSQQHSLVVDATGSMVVKLNGKEVFYFAFLSFDRSLKTEPVAHIEILTEKATYNTLKFALSSFLEDEMRSYNYTTYSVPILCTSDCSWPIIKCLIGAFNNETLEQYISRSFKIVSGFAENDTLPIQYHKTFLHISLCHSMKSFCRKINKLFKSDKNFVKYCTSVVANTRSLNDLFQHITHLFQLLLAPYSVQCDDDKSYFHDKIVNIEICNEDIAEEFPSQLDSNHNIFEMPEIQELPIKEDTYLRQSKRSIYYQKCKSFFLEVSNKVTSHGKLDSSEVNPYFNREYALYFLNNWCGLLPLWSSLHLGDQGRHGTSECYRNWSQKFSHRECVQDPPRTQGIVEFHNKSVKHISMNSKRERIDSVVGNLFVAKKLKLRQLEIVKSRKPKNKDEHGKIKDAFPKKIATEKWSKRLKKISVGPDFFQTSQGFNLDPQPNAAAHPKEAWLNFP